MQRLPLYAILATRYMYHIILVGVLLLVSFVPQAIPQGVAVHSVGVHLAGWTPALVGGPVLVETRNRAGLVNARGSRKVPLPWGGHFAQLVGTNG